MKEIVAQRLKYRVQNLKFTTYLINLRNVRLYVTEILQNILFKTMNSTGLCLTYKGASYLYLVFFIQYYGTLSELNIQKILMAPFAFNNDSYGIFRSLLTFF